MFDLHQDERTFWKNMNPMRLHALFTARFVPKQKKQESLVNYLMGGE